MCGIKSTPVIYPFFDRIFKISAVIRHLWYIFYLSFFWDFPNVLQFRIVAHWKKSTFIIAAKLSLLLHIRFDNNFNSKILLLRLIFHSTANPLISFFDKTVASSKTIGVLLGSLLSRQRKTCCASDAFPFAYDYYFATRYSEESSPKRPRTFTFSPIFSVSSANEIDR